MPKCQADSLYTRQWNAALQDPEQQPSINEVKDELLKFAHTHFQSRTPAEALALKHAKEKALLDQILPPKVSSTSTLLKIATIRQSDVRICQSVIFFAKEA